MSEPRTAVRCQKSECMFYEAHADGAPMAWCTHTDKQHYMLAERCPLFRIDFQRQMRQPAQGTSPKDFLKIIRKR